MGQGQEGLALRGGLGAGATDEVVILGREEWVSKREEGGDRAGP